MHPVAGGVLAILAFGTSVAPSGPHTSVPAASLVSQTQPSPPTFAPTSAAYAWRVTNCSVICALSDLVADDAAQRTIFLRSTVPTATDLSVTGMSLVLESKQTGASTTVSDGLTFVPAPEDGLARVEVKLPDLDPAAYSGALVLAVSAALLPSRFQSSSNIGSDRSGRSSCSSARCS